MMGPGKGNGKRANIGGPANALPPTPGTPSSSIASNSIGLTPYGNDKGGRKMANDNVRDKINREVQRDYGTGKNNMQAINRDLYRAGFGNPPGGMMNKAKTFLGMDTSMHVGRGIETADLFGKAKTNTEVACSKTCTACAEYKGCDKKEKIITSNK